MARDELPLSLDLRPHVGKSLMFGAVLAAEHVRESRADSADRGVAVHADVEFLELPFEDSTTRASVHCELTIFSDDTAACSYRSQRRRQQTIQHSCVVPEDCITALMFQRSNVLRRSHVRT